MKLASAPLQNAAASLRTSKHCPMPSLRFRESKDPFVAEV